MSKFDGDQEEVFIYISKLENEVPTMLNAYFGTNYQSIYELQDDNEVEQFRKRIKVTPQLKEIDMNEDPRYTEVLKYYRLFVKTLSANSIPIPVPGEEKSEQQAESTPSATSVSTKTKQTTIYLEGEAGEAQTKEYRQRNMELRQACIDHFKTLHEGRIVCECCGFDFSKAYDIDDEYIEIHHRFPFSQTEGEHPVDATTDLVPLCANCHRMIHHNMGGKGNCMSLDELKRKLK